MNPKVTKILGLLGIFLIVSGISYFLFDYFLPSCSGGLLKSFSQRQPSSDQNQDQNQAKPELYPGFHSNFRLSEIFVNNVNIRQRLENK